MSPESADNSSSWSELKSRENWNNLAIIALVGLMLFGWIVSKSALSFSLPWGDFFAYALFAVGELVGCYRLACIIWRNSNSLSIWGKLRHVIRGLKPLLRIATLLPFAAALWCLRETLSSEGFSHTWPNIALAVGDIGWASLALVWPLYISRSIILLPEDIADHEQRLQEFVARLRWAWQISAVVGVFIAASYLLVRLGVSPYWRDRLAIGLYFCFSLVAGLLGRKNPASTADKPAA
ncbi:MAG TPA: hypothetical protein VN229_17610 [Terriglobales bacterium]|nr:hypothetical protein [Terriglobales bacterium]